MHVLFITSDSSFFDKNGERHAQLTIMQDAAEVLHVVVLTNRKSGFSIQPLGEKGWIYPTNSWFPFLYIWDGWRTIRTQLFWKGELYIHLVVSDDAYSAGWLGALISNLYDRTWMLHVHTFYWDIHSSSTPLIKRFLAVPLAAVFNYTYRIFSFSEKVSVYLTAAAQNDLEKHKIVLYPAVYDPHDLQNAQATINIKEVHPDFNFIILTTARGWRLQLAIQATQLLRKSYRKAGLVVISGNPHITRLRTLFSKTSSFVHFESESSNMFSYLKTANVFLYLDSGEYEDDMLLRAAASSCPIIAAASPVSTRVIKDSVNGYLLEHPTSQTLTKTIQNFNESAGVREKFKMNSSLYLEEQFAMDRSTLVAQLKEYWTFQEEKLENFPLLTGQDKLLSRAIPEQPSTIREMFKPLQKTIDYFLGK